MRHTVECDDVRIAEDSAFASCNWGRSVQLYSQIIVVTCVRLWPEIIVMQLRFDTTIISPPITPCPKSMFAIILGDSFTPPINHVFSQSSTDGILFFRFSDLRTVTNIENKFNCAAYITLSDVRELQF